MTLSRGQTLSHYRLIEQLGQGGMGVVWRAHDLKLERDVALKLLPESTQHDPGRRQRMLREARAAAAIRHPAICAVYEIDEAEGRIFIAMECVDGEPLNRVLARGPLEFDRALSLAGEILGALEVAHANGIVHRDLKPANVMLTRQGHVKLLDFGLAKALPQRETDEAKTATALTQQGTVVGTPCYMSPEQLQGRQADTRSDLFAFGLLLYEAITGKHPFGESTPIATAASILNRPPTPVSQERAGVPVAVEETLRRLLAKEPALRYACAAEVRSALADLASAPAPTPTPVDRLTPRVEPSIAVLPFVDMSAERDQDWFCEGLAEELINGLMRLEGLRVAARTSAFRFARGDHDVRDIGRQLGVRTVVEGSVRKAGQRLRVSLRLINADDGYQLWSQRYDRDLADVFQVQDEISAAILEALQVELLAQAPAPARSDAPDVEAYQAYLRGRHLWGKRNEAALLQSVEQFRHAIALEPRYAAAHAGLADVYNSLGAYGALPPSEAMPQSRSAAEQALRLDPASAEARCSLACVLALHDWSWSAAEQAFREALRCNPHYPTPHLWYATSVLVPQRRFAEAHVELQRARELDPLSPAVRCSIAMALYTERRHDEAIRELEEVLALDPDVALAHHFIGRARSWIGEHEAAIGALERARGGSDSPEIAAYLAAALAAAGQRDRATELLDELHARSEQRYVSPGLLAPIQGALGWIDDAFASVDQACEQRSTELAWMLVGPMSDPLRDDARFDRALQRIGLGG